ncbi:serine hydrolase domain-containing protein [Brachybacterium sp. GCM10030267]|uniref:serine hydrolase domain-containing protein n=1 Tax=Brachybacterium sp. GCM10030267 TaxID=3273381 RepID=UPI003623D28C
MTTDLTRLLSRHVESGTMPGAVATCGHGYEPVAVGTDAPGGSPLRTGAIFRIQSMTKIVTSVAALRLVQDGVLGLDDPVAEWMPELAEPRVLTSAEAELEDTVPASRPITLRHLLTNRSGYGMMTTDSPLKRAMVASRVEPGNEPLELGAQEWLEALAALPLAFQPGDGWRYHVSFGVLGILLGRLTGESTHDVLRRTVLDPAGMPDTGFAVPREQAHRLLPAFRRTEHGLEQIEPAGAGFYADPPPFDVSHSELVSTLSDFHAFLRALLDGDLLGPELLGELRRDQVPDSVKTPESFFPGFWEGNGWGYGVSVVTDGPHRGRFGWSGGMGTDFFADPDGSICLVMTQVEMDEQIFALLGELQELGGP